MPAVGARTFRSLGILDDLNVGLPEAGAGGQRAYLTAQLVSGLVTFISAYHYKQSSTAGPSLFVHIDADGQPAGLGLTSLPFHDAYLYMDWLLAVPILLIEIVLAMKLTRRRQRTHA